MANTLAPHQGVVVGQAVLKYLRKNTVFPKLITTDFGTEAQEKGASIKVPKIGSFTTNAKTLGASVTVQNAVSTLATITLDQHREVSFIIDDFETAISDGDIKNMYMQAAVDAIAEKVDSDIAGLYAGLSQTVPGSANGTALTSTILIAGRKQLSDAKAPNTDRYLVAGTEAYSQLLTLPEFVSAERYGSSSAIMDGELGKVYGFKVFESQSIVTATADQNLMFHKRAFGMAVRPLKADVSITNGIQQVVSDPQSGLSVRVTMWYNMDKMGTQCTIDLLYGFAELDDALATKLLS